MPTTQSIITNPLNTRLPSVMDLSALSEQISTTDTQHGGRHSVFVGKVAKACEKFVDSAWDLQGAQKAWELARRREVNIRSWDTASKNIWGKSEGKKAGSVRTCGNEEDVAGRFAAVSASFGRLYGALLEMQSLKDTLSRAEGRSDAARVSFSTFAQKADTWLQEVAEKEWEKPW